MRRKIIRDLLCSGYALAVTVMIGKWAIRAAYLERGYEAVGGEYLLIMMAFCVAYKLFEIFIKALEEEHGSKKRRGRRIVGMRNYRGRIH